MSRKNSQTAKRHINSCPKSIYPEPPIKLLDFSQITYPVSTGLANLRAGLPEEQPISIDFNSLLNASILRLTAVTGCPCLIGAATGTFFGIGGPGLVGSYRLEGEYGPLDGE